MTYYGGPSKLHSGILISEWESNHKSRGVSKVVHNNLSCWNKIPSYTGFDPLCLYTVRRVDRGTFGPSPQSPWDFGVYSPSPVKLEGETSGRWGTKRIQWDLLRDDDSVTYSSVSVTRSKLFSAISLSMFPCLDTCICHPLLPCERTRPRPPTPPSFSSDLRPWFFRFFNRSFQVSSMIQSLIQFLKVQYV